MRLDFDLPQTSLQSGADLGGESNKRFTRSALTVSELQTKRIT